jgi:hypothetical protein
MGAFKLTGPQDENFNLEPKDIADRIPDDQRKISHEVYEVINVLKFLKNRGAFKGDDSSFKDFVKRVLEAARVGCTMDNVKTDLAAEALEQIRKDIIRRKGKRIHYRYLATLFALALGGMVVGMLAILAGRLAGRPAGYGWVIVGSMAGAWLSLAATRGEVSFENMQEFLDLSFEPLVRMLFVAVLGSVFALFLQLNALSVSIGSVDLSKFSEGVRPALLLGVITGISERAVSTQVIERAKKVLT